MRHLVAEAEAEAKTAPEVLVVEAQDYHLLMVVMEAGQMLKQELRHLPTKVVVVAVVVAQQALVPQVALRSKLDKEQNGNFSITNSIQNQRRAQH
jgi:hypothetical protein